MNKFLLDANLSPRTRMYLTDTFHFDVIDLQSSHQGQLPDEDVVVLARTEERIIITLAHHSRKGIGKRGILWHTEKHERRVLFDNRAH